MRQFYCDSHRYQAAAHLKLTRFRGEAADSASSVQPMGRATGYHSRDRHSYTITGLQLLSTIRRGVVRDRLADATRRPGINDDGFPVLFADERMVVVGSRVLCHWI